MAQLFPRWANAAARAILVAVGCVAIGVPLGLMGWVRTPNATGQYAPIDQPIPFAHVLHVRGFRIDCRYCHASVERAPTAGMPPTSTCIPCHNEVWRTSSVLAPVRQSLAAGRPIAWRRVNKLPDFVFFDHSIHVAKGVGCETCHGRVDLMARVYQTAPLTMGWCLECHRDPAPRLRPVEQVTTMGWASDSQPALGRELARRYRVRSLGNCTTCHR